MSILAAQLKFLSFLGALMGEYLLSRHTFATCVLLAAGATLPLSTAVARPAGDGGFLAISDVHLLAGEEGVCFSCETPEPLWEAAQSAASNLISAQSPDFVIYLGDLPAHSQDIGPRERQFSEVLNGLQRLVAGSETPLLYLPGNNDTIGPNYCGFTFNGQTVFDFSSNETAWPIVGGDAEAVDDSHLAQGYYSAELKVADGASDLWVMALNTVMFTSRSQASGCGGTGGMFAARSQVRQAAATQLDWLAAQLSKARTAGVPVMLAMHVPPGIDGFNGHHSWDRHLDYRGTNPAFQYRSVQSVFLEIVSEYSAEITGIFAGHTHLNGIQLLQSCSGGDPELLVSVPGITTDHGNYPAMKMVHFGPGLEPVDAVVYYAEGGPNFTWDSGASFGFSANYPNSAPAGSTLLEQINAVPDGTLWPDMWQYLFTGADSNRYSTRFYEESIEVSCED